MKKTQKHPITPLRVIIHLGGWLPLLILLIQFLSNRLTVNPIQALEQRSGDIALIFLLLSLACTPFAAIFGWGELIQRRKALGNYGFLYAVVHVLTFLGLDYGLNLAAVWRDVGNKVYILVGAAAFLLLIPLAVTSIRYWMKRLSKHWKSLHRLVYIISPLVMIHFFLVVKGSLAQLQGDLLRPMIYALVLVFLLALRILPLKKALIRLVARIRRKA